MGIAGLVFALFTLGYILGVWTACLVFRQPQRAYEEGVTGAKARQGKDLQIAPGLTTREVVLRDVSRVGVMQP